MKINNTTIETINKNFVNTLFSRPIPDSRKSNLRLDEVLSGTSVLKGNWEICKLEDLNDTINQLTLLKEEIEKVTGLVLED